jgi:hypothetical protein
MTRQPCLFANSLISGSDISRTTRSSAGCVTTYSDPIDSASRIFAASAGRSGCMCRRSNVQSRGVDSGTFSLAAAEAAVLFFDLTAAPARDALCDSAKVRVRLVFPWLISFRRGGASRGERLPISLDAWHKRRYNNFGSLARPRRTARFCGWFRKRLSCGGILLIR